MGDIDLEIEQTELKIKALSRKLEELKKKKEFNALVKGVDYGFLPKLDENLDRLIELVKIHPGITRGDLAIYFSSLSYKELTDLITKARRNRKMIENRGTRSKPLWFPR